MLDCRLDRFARLFIQAQASECGRGQPRGAARPSEAVGGLPNATNRRMIGLRKPANGDLWTPPVQGCCGGGNELRCVNLSGLSLERLLVAMMEVARLRLTNPTAYAASQIASASRASFLALLT
jgi:hypothetical protein